MLGDEALNKPIWELLVELLRVSGILGVAIHGYDPRVRFTDAQQRGAEGFARSNQIAELVISRRITRGRVIFGRGELAGSRDSMADTRLCCRLEFGNGASGFVF